MAERNYNGPVIDCTWSNGPWSNNGKTIEASDDNAENGNMSTIAWPEGATPKEELSDEQIAVINKAARYRNINSTKKLTALAVGDRRSNSYAGSVLKVHWPERYWVPIEETTDEEYINALEASEVDKTEQNQNIRRTNDRSKLTEEDVKEIRVRAKNGEGAAKLAEEFPVGRKSINSAINGDTWAHIEDYPPLEYDHGKEKYVPKGDYAETEEELFDEPEQSTLEEQEQEQEQDTPDFEPSPVTQESSTDYTKYISIVAAIYMVYRLIRRLF